MIPFKKLTAYDENTRSVATDHTEPIESPEIDKEEELRYTESQARRLAIDFFYHWWNQPGNNTEQGFDEWIKTVNLKP